MTRARQSPKAILPNLATNLRCYNFLLEINPVSSVKICYKKVFSDKNKESCLKSIEKIDEWYFLTSFMNQ